MFHNSYKASYCWGYGDINAYSSRFTDCTIYGVPKEINDYKKRRAREMQKVFDEAIRKPSW